MVYSQDQRSDRAPAWLKNHHNTHRQMLKQNDLNLKYVNKYVCCFFWLRLDIIMRKICRWNISYHPVFDCNKKLKYWYIFSDFAPRSSSAVCPLGITIFHIPELFLPQEAIYPRALNAAEKKSNMVYLERQTSKEIFPAKRDLKLWKIDLHYLDNEAYIQEAIYPRDVNATEKNSIMVYLERQISKEIFPAKRHLKLWEIDLHYLDNGAYIRSSSKPVPCFYVFKRLVSLATESYIVVDIIRSVDPVKT